MEQFIRNNFKIVEWKSEDGSISEGFEYIAPNGNKRITELKTFLDNTEKFQSIIDYWKSEGMNVPQ